MGLSCVKMVMIMIDSCLCLSQGSFKCGQCKVGFVGNQTSGCFLRRGCALLGYDPCDVNAHCVMERSSDISCVVRTLTAFQTLSILSILHCESHFYKALYETEKTTNGDF